MVTPAQKNPDFCKRERKRGKRICSCQTSQEKKRIIRFVTETLNHIKLLYYIWCMHSYHDTLYFYNCKNVYLQVLYFCCKMCKLLLREHIATLLLFQKDIKFFFSLSQLWFTYPYIIIQKYHFKKTIYDTSGFWGPFISHLSLYCFALYVLPPQ